MASSTVENYLKILYGQQQHARGRLVAMGALATGMNVTPGTATTMVKALAESGLVDYRPRGGVRLTTKGEKLALHVLRRHRLVELFLVEVLGLDWSEVDVEAEELEHAISEKVLGKIDELLKFPQVDPHGDPIPSPKGKLVSRELLSLAECELGRPMRIARVMDQQPAFLKFANQHGLKPGTHVVVKKRDAVADAISIQPKKGNVVTLGGAAAGKILVEQLP